MAIIVPWRVSRGHILFSCHACFGDSMRFARRFGTDRELPVDRRGELGNGFQGQRSGGKRKRQRMRSRRRWRNCARERLPACALPSPLRPNRHPLPKPQPRRKPPFIPSLRRIARAGSCRRSCNCRGTGSVGSGTDCCGGQDAPRALSVGSRPQPRRAADGVSARTRSTTAICCRAKPIRTSSPASPSPMPTIRRTPSASTITSRSCGSCPRRRCCRTAAPGAACRSSATSIRCPTASRHRRHLERERLARLARRRHRHLLGQRARHRRAGRPQRQDQRHHPVRARDGFADARDQPGHAAPRFGGLLPRHQPPGDRGVPRDPQAVGRLQPQGAEPAPRRADPRRLHGSGPRRRRMDAAQPQGRQRARQGRCARAVPEAGRDPPRHRRAVHRVQRPRELGRCPSITATWASRSRPRTCAARSRCRPARITSARTAPRSAACRRSTSKPGTSGRARRASSRT